MMRAASRREMARYGDAVQVVTPATVNELRDAVRDAEAAGRGVAAAGLGAHGAVGAAPPDTLLVSTAALKDVVKYEPDDFTIGVQAGMPLAELRERLAANGQELPVDFGAAAAGTVGGLVARAPAWPRQHFAGSLSALLLGATGVRGGGVPFRSGGMVVKNVAGYQVHKLMIASFGRLGVVTHANFRLRPIPARRRMRFAAGDADAASALSAALRASGTEPAIAVLRGGAVTAMRDAGHPVPEGEAAVAWLFEGRAERVAWQATRADEVAAGAAPERGDPAEQDDAVRALHDLTALTEPAGEATAVFRAALLPSRGPAALSELHVAFAAADRNAALMMDAWTGVVHARWNPRAGDPAAEAAGIVRRREGVARLLAHAAGPPDGILFPAADEAVARTVRSVFDPRGTFALAAASPEESA